MRFTTLLQNSRRLLKSSDFKNRSNCNLYGLNLRHLRRIFKIVDFRIFSSKLMMVIQLMVAILRNFSRTFLLLHVHQPYLLKLQVWKFWSAGFKNWSNCNLLGLNFRCLCKIFEIVVFGISSCKLVRDSDFEGLLTNVSLTTSIVSSETAVCGDYWTDKSHIMFQ